MAATSPPRTSARRRATWRRSRRSRRTSAGCRAGSAARATRARGPRSACRPRSSCAASGSSASPSLQGRTIAISGLGNVGGRVATACAEAGATLLVTDIDPRKRALADGLGARWLEPGEALTAPADVFAPCALGGLLDHESVGAAAGADRRGRREQPARGRRRRRRARRARGAVGAGLRRQRGRDHQHLRRARARWLRPAPRGRAVRGIGDTLARSSTTPRRAAPRRWTPRWRWRASGSPKPRG